MHSNLPPDPVHYLRAPAVPRQLQHAVSNPPADLLRHGQSGQLRQLLHLCHVQFGQPLEARVQPHLDGPGLLFGGYFHHVPGLGQKPGTPEQGGRVLPGHLRLKVSVFIWWWYLEIPL